MTSYGGSTDRIMDGKSHHDIFRIHTPDLEITSSIVRGFLTSGGIIQLSRPYTVQPWCDKVPSGHRGLTKSNPLIWACSSKVGDKRGNRFHSTIGSRTTNFSISFLRAQGTRNLPAVKHDILIIDTGIVPISR